MTGSGERVTAVVDAVLGYLRVRHADDPAVERLLDRYDSVDPRVMCADNRPRHEHELGVVLADLVSFWAWLSDTGHPCEVAVPDR